MTIKVKRRKWWWVKVFTGVFFGLGLLMYFAFALQTWATAGGDLQQLVAGARTFKDYMLVIQMVFVLLLWMYWDKYVTSRVSEKAKPSMSAQRTPICLFAGILLLMLWLF